MAVSSQKPNAEPEFLALFLQHQPKIYAYIRSLVPAKADADDVMQETARFLWERFDEFEPGTHFDRWAMRVAYHRVRYQRQKWARESKRLIFSDEVFELLSEASIPFRDTDDEVREALESCVAKLPAEEQSLLAQRFETGNTTTDS